MTRGLATCIAALALFAAAAPARAQSWRHPPLVDYDQELEEHSSFWEQAGEANKEDYLGRVATAQELWAQGTDPERKLALRTLKEARDAHPKEPEAYYWLGELSFEAREWVACASALERLFTIDPTFSPKKPRQGRSPNYTLAGCYLYSGNYEQAETQYRRIMTLRYSTTEVSLRLGEALMALGRLDEAIEVLRAAVDISSRSEPRFALAVALDRAEELSQSASVLRQAIGRDPGLATLVSVDKTYSPAEDEHYYLGLAHGAAGRQARSLYHFRRYLSQVPDSPWKARAQDHLRKLEGTKLGDDLTVLGSAGWRTEDLTKSVRTHKDQLLACVKGHPLLLLQVSVSSVRRRGVGDGAGVRVTVLAQAETKPDALRSVVECTEAAARRIKAPRLSGPSGSYAHAEFSLIDGQK
jgi:tetratricopeptide (TPR) repeat protein